MNLHKPSPLWPIIGLSVEFPSWAGEKFDASKIPLIKIDAFCPSCTKATLYQVLELILMLPKTQPDAPAEQL